MAGNVENLMLEHLKRFQTTLERMENKVDDLTRRFSNLETGQANVLQQLAHLAAVDAQLQISIDTLNARVSRIEHRLELA